MSKTGLHRNPLALLLIALIAIVLIDQSRFLFVYPVPDTGMWFGDESWTMLTVRALIRTGVARVPEALGSSLAGSNGFVNGSIWISGFFYGVPAVVFSSLATPVGIGRTVTLLVSFISLVVVYRLSRAIGVLPAASLLGIFALVLSNAFYFSSHSARLDATTGLAVLLYFYLLISVYRQIGAGGSPDLWAYLLPLFAALSLAVYVHVPALIVLPMIFSLWKLGAFRRVRTVALSFAGAVSGVVFLVGIYWISFGSFNLLGKGYNQYYNVVNSLPVLHLTSWRVQKINTIDRAIQVWEVACPMVIAIATGISLRIWKSYSFQAIERFFLVNAALMLMGWGLFGGPAVYYNIHILPVMAVCVAISIAPAFYMPLKKSVQWSFALLLIVLACMTIASQEQDGNAGNRLVIENSVAIHFLVDPLVIGSYRPIVLTDEPAENEIAGDPNVRLMTNHLLLFGDEDKPFPEILREHHVDYLLLYSTNRWHSPFRTIADSLYTFVGSRTGTLTDQARGYDDHQWKELDTLRLYKAK